MKKILCLTDLTDVSASAIEYAAQTARKTLAELVLMHVLELPKLTEAVVTGYGYPLDTEERKQAAEEKLFAIEAALKTEFQIPCHAVVVSKTQSFENTVEKAIAENHYDLIVMGTNGAETLQQYLFGKHSDHLIKQIKAPLLIIPADYRFNVPKKIIYASDYESSDTLVLQRIKALLGAYQPSVCMLHVSGILSPVSDILYKSIINGIEDELDDPSIYFERVFDANTVDGIDHFMKEERKDMLVLLAKNKTFLDKLLGEGVIKQLNERASYPLLIIHAAVEERHHSPLAPGIVF